MDYNQLNTVLKHNKLITSEKLAILESEKLSLKIPTSWEDFLVSKKINEVWSVTYKPIVITLEDVRWAWDFYLYLDCGDFDKSRFKEKLIERCTK